MLKTEKPLENILIKGWVRTKRDSKTFSFIEVNDGSCLKNIQIVVDEKTPDYHEIKKLTTGSALAVWGNMSLPKVAARNGKFRPQRSILSAWRRNPFLYRKNATPTNICEPLPT